MFAILLGGITVNGKLNYTRERKSSCCLVSVFQNEIKSKVSDMFIRSLVYLFAPRFKKKKLHLVFVGIHELACENIRFFSLFVPGGEERGDTDVFAGYT